MTGQIVSDQPGHIGPIGVGWSVELDSMPHSALDSSPSTGVVTFTSEAGYNTHLTMDNNSTFTFIDDDLLEMPPVAIGITGSGGGGSGGGGGGGSAMPYGTGFYGSGTYGGSAGSGTSGAGTAAVPYGFSGYGSGYYGGGSTSSGTITPAGFNSGSFGAGGFNDTAPGLVYDPPGSLQLSSEIAGTIDSVSIQGRVASFTQGTGFTQFATSDIDVPAVTSGSPVAAFAMAYQLAGNTPCQYGDMGGRYWSLRGHDTGFDWLGSAIVPKDQTMYKLAADGSTFRKWNVTDSFASTGWAVADGDFWSTGGVGSSVTTAKGQRTLIVATLDLSGRSTVFQFGTSSATGFLGFGPDDSHTSRGKWFSLSLHGPTLSATLNGAYRSGGNIVAVNRTAALAGIDVTLPVQVVIDIGYPTSNTFAFTAYMQNVDTTGNPAVITSGILSTAVDLYAAPWKVAGYLHGLYTTTGSYSSTDPTDYLGAYEDWSVKALCDIDNFGISTPILPFTGNLWDYLTQVCVARQVGLRILDGQYAMSAMSDDSIHAQKWSPAASPTFAIDNSTVAANVEVDAQFTSFKVAPRVYDALDEGNQSYSLTPGTTNVFSITTTCINALVYNPEPLFDTSDLLKGNHPYGAYIVTGPDNLPIKPAEWISFGGSVSVEQAGLNTLSMSVVTPDLPLGTTSGNYSLAVSDGSNSYAMLRLTSPAGGLVVDHKTVFETGASVKVVKPQISSRSPKVSNPVRPQRANNSNPVITNVAATNHQALQNVAAWAVAEASGPTMTLSGEMPLADLRYWQSTDFGFVPGATILYRNMQWRIRTCTISNISIQFTARPFLTYESECFAVNWDGLTVDDYTTFWEGKTYGDMNTMALAGPNYDWGPGGAEARYTVYPGGGSAADDPGLDPSVDLDPSTVLVPDAPGFMLVGGLFPAADDFPGAQDYTTVQATFNLGQVYPEPADTFPGSDEDPS